MPANDRQVFEKLTSEGGPESHLNFLAYALFAFHKSKWIELYKSTHNGQEPQQAEIDDWISNITDFQFNDMKLEAGRLFDVAARDYLEDEIQEEKEQAVSASILSEIKRFTSAWRHLGVALLMAIVAPVLLGGIVLLIGLYHGSFPIQFTTH